MKTIFRDFSFIWATDHLNLCQMWHLEKFNVSDHFLSQQEVNSPDLSVRS